VEFGDTTFKIKQQNKEKKLLWIELIYSFLYNVDTANISGYFYKYHFHLTLLCFISDLERLS
jgi:hypothetical protein